jgi:hypothetical protein
MKDYGKGCLLTADLDAFTRQGGGQVGDIQETILRAAKLARKRAPMQRLKLCNERCVPGYC